MVRQSYRIEYATSINAYLLRESIIQKSLISCEWIPRESAHVCYPMEKQARCAFYYTNDKHNKSSTKPKAYCDTCSVYLLTKSRNSTTSCLTEQHEEATLNLRTKHQYTQLGPFSSSVKLSTIRETTSTCLFSFIVVFAINNNWVRERNSTIYSLHLNSLENERI